MIMLNIIFNRGTKDIENENYVFSPDTYFKYKVLVNKYVGLISLQYYQTIIAYIIDTMPIATVSNIAQ